MTGLELYAVLKFWLPLATAFGLVIKAYSNARDGVTEWADKLLNNHLHSIQTTGEQTVAILTEVRDDSKNTVHATNQMVIHLMAHDEEERKINQGIVSALEVLKDRQ